MRRWLLGCLVLAACGGDVSGPDDTKPRPAYSLVAVDGTPPVGYTGRLVIHTDGRFTDIRTAASDGDTVRADRGGTYVILADTIDLTDDWTRSTVRGRWAADSLHFRDGGIHYVYRATH